MIGLLACSRWFAEPCGALVPAQMTFVTNLNAPALGSRESVTLTESVPLDRAVAPSYPPNGRRTIRPLDAVGVLRARAGTPTCPLESARSQFGQTIGSRTMSLYARHTMQAGGEPDQPILTAALFAQISNTRPTGKPRLTSN